MELDQFRIDGEAPQSPSKPLKDPPRPVVPWCRGHVLAVDQSLSSSGWVHLVNVQGEVLVMDAGVLRSKDNLSGHEKTLFRGEVLFSEFMDMLAAIRPDAVVHETPPVGGRMARPESSLLASLALRNAIAVYRATDGEYVNLKMIGSQKAKKRWTGNGNAKKTELKAALECLGFDDLKSRGMPWNEHVADALGIGLLYIEENW